MWDFHQISYLAAVGNKDGLITVDFEVRRSKVKVMTRPNRVKDHLFKNKNRPFWLMIHHQRPSSSDFLVCFQQVVAEEVYLSLWRSSSPRTVKVIDRCHVMSARLMPVELNWCAWPGWPTDCLDSSAVIVALARDARDWTVVWLFRSKCIVYSFVK